MAGAISGQFISGANARIKIDGATLAYCTDVAFTVDVATIPIEVMGTYEVKAYEPVAYSVSGSFSVVRYTKNFAPVDGAATGNAPESIGETNTMGRQINPGQVLSSTSFDMDIMQLVGGDGITGASAPSAVYKINDCRVTRRSSGVNKRGVMVDAYTFVGILGGDTDNGDNAQLSGFKDLVTS